MLTPWRIHTDASGNTSLQPYTAKMCSPTNTQAHPNHRTAPKVEIIANPNPPTAKSHAHTTTLTRQITDTDLFK